MTLEYRNVWQHYRTDRLLPFDGLYAGCGGQERARHSARGSGRSRPDFPIHVDFLRVSRTSRIDVEVPVQFINEEASPGLKRGGVLNIVRHSIEFSCPADAIPEKITIDLTGLDIGDGVHISAVPLPAGITPTITDRDFTIATIAGAAAARPETETETAATEEEKSE